MLMYIITLFFLCSLRGQTQKPAVMSSPSCWLEKPANAVLC